MAATFTSTQTYPNSFEKHDTLMDDSQGSGSQVLGFKNGATRLGRKGYHSIWPYFTRTADYLVASLVQLSLITKSKGSTTTDHRPHDVLAEFNYHKDLPEGQAYPTIYVTRPETQMFSMCTEQMMVRDIRGEEEKFTLDTTGFEVSHHVSKEKNFSDDTEIEKVYYPEIEALLKST